jgi:hypothetical protein
MELVIHSGFGQTEPHVTVGEPIGVSGTCTVTTYRFVDHKGAVLDVRLYEHAPTKPMPAKPTKEKV